MLINASHDPNEPSEREMRGSRPPDWLDIASTRAANNRFFRLCAANVTPQMRGPFLVNWHPITERFCLGTLQYVGLLAKLRVACRSQRDVEALERALAAAVDIGAGEFGFGRHGRQAFHYNMFARLREPPAARFDEHSPRECMRVPETDHLLEWFGEAFSDARLGAGVLRVVEHTAFNIVRAMDRLFPAGTCGTSGWSEHQREYIALHLELEPVHACTVEQLVEALALSRDSHSSIEYATATTCDLFGKFWDRMATDVFGP